MELIKFSKFRNQLQTLITEFHELKEKEKSSNEQLNLHIQKQKQTEEKFSKEVLELNLELERSNEKRQKLKRKVCYLQNENALLENKQKDVKATMDSLLSSREKFENAYQDSTCEMKRSIEIKDRKLNLLSGKINSHLLLFESIQKEALSVKQVVDNVHRLVSEKEDVVAGLRSKMDTVSAFEKVFAEKTIDLESKIQKYRDELRQKDGIISDLKAQDEARKISSNNQPQIEELQRTISANELTIQNLISEKKALHFEVGSLGFILQKIQETVVLMNEEDKGVFSSMLETQQEFAVDKAEDNYRFEDATHCTRENSPFKPNDRVDEEVSVSSQSTDQNSVGNCLQENNNFSSCVADSTCVDPQLASNDQSVSVNEAKDACTAPVHPLDSECSTTQAEISEHPGESESGPQSECAETHRKLHRISANRTTTSSFVEPISHFHLTNTQRT